MKKFLNIIFAFVMCFTMVLGFASCNLTETNTQGLYGKKVAEISTSSTTIS